LKKYIRSIRFKGVTSTS